MFEYDPDAIDRGTTAHKDTQDALSAAVSSAGLEPLSPRAEDPQFDLAWIRGQKAFVVEVKSLTPANEEKQLRLGLGQVLSYAHLLDWEDVDEVAPVLAVERKPAAVYWADLCKSLGVELTWPERFEESADLT